jgi:tetratricopeptide (TPR) repeat protein
MTKEKFTYFIANPTEVSAHEIEEFESVANEYPYCQLVHSLLAKAYSKHSSEELSQEKIRRAAASALSRNALRKIVRGTFTNQSFNTSITKFDSEYIHKLDSILEAKEEETNRVAHAYQQEILSDRDFLTYSSAAEDALLNEIAQKQQLQNVIIDNFLIKDPGLIRTTKSQLEAMGKQEDLSIKSGKLEKGIVTESYAKILTMQGRKDKAIGVYEKLILKFPEKKAYFASKIQELLDF